MTLVDTSVWIDHLRYGNPELIGLLQKNEVLIHPFVIGELLCGSLKNRRAVRELLEALPKATVADRGEILHLLEERRLYGKGIGWIDAALLTSALLSRVRLWTVDKRLNKIYRSLQN